MQVHLRSRSRRLVISVACALLSFMGIAQLAPHSARADVNEIAVGAPTAASFASLTGGQQHTCAVLAAGTVKCWGSNSSGQIGIGNTTTPQILPVDVITAPSTPLTNVVAVSAFGNFTCALRSAGTVMCWGLNSSGQIGNGNTTPTQSTPVEVVGLAGVSAITTGERHACALLSTGSVKCWGYNFYGQLGNDGLVNSSSPVDVLGLTGAVAISAGGNHTCALLSTGSVKCWGLNSSGQVGNDEFVDSRSPVDVITARSTPLGGVTAISSGAAHTCALVSGGVKCWGDNQTGQLGNGSSGTGFRSATPVDVVTEDVVTKSRTPLGGVTAISTKAHSCALVSGGMKCWGSNNQGQLGNGKSGARELSSMPDVSVGPSSVIAMTTGNGHTCALLSTGKLTCWGWNFSGQLGNNTPTTSSTSAVDVSGLSSGVTTTVTLAPTTVPPAPAPATPAPAPAPVETVPETTVLDTVPPTTLAPPAVQVESLPDTGSPFDTWLAATIGILLLGGVLLAARRRLAAVGN